MKKKLFTALLLAAVTVSACGAEEGSGRGSVNDREEKPAEPTDAEPTEAPAEKPTESEPVSPEQSVSVDDGKVHPLHFDIQDVYEHWNNEDYTRFASTNAPEIVLVEKEYSNLAGSVSSYGKALQSMADEDMQYMLNVLQNPENYEGVEESIFYTSEYYTEVARADSVAVSFLTTQYVDYQGAHPNTVYLGANFDSLTGAKLSVYEVVNDTDQLPELVADALLDKYDAETFFSAEDLPGTIDDALGMNGDLSFTLGYEGITFYFSPYELAPYAFGPQIVTLRYADYPALVREEYQRTTENYIVALNAVGDNLLPDGRTLTLSILPVEEEFTDTYKVETSLDGEAASFEIYDAFSMTPWLVHIDNRNYLYLTWGTYNDYAMLSVCDLNGQKVGAPKDYDRSFHGAQTDPEDLWLRGRGYLLSTVTIARSYHVGSDGMPVENMDYDRVSSPLTLTLKKDLNCEVRTDFDDPKSSSVEKLQKGTEITFYATNEDESWVDFILSDGRYVRIYVEYDDYSPTVDGTPINDLFDGMLFAG